MALHDPESSAYEEKQALKEGRQKKVNITLEQVDEFETEEEDEAEEEDDDEETEEEMMTVEGEDGQYVVLEVIQLQDEEEQKPKPVIKTDTDVAFEEVNIPEDRDALAGTTTDFILSEDLTNQMLMSSYQPPAKKARYESVSQSTDIEKDMSNCFGFDDDEDDSEGKPNITLLH